MPRSVPHDLEGHLRDIQLRVWERRQARTFHAIAEGRFVHRCDRGLDHELDVRSRWDIGSEADPWYGLARRARDGDGAAAHELAARMVDEALEDEWHDPCPSTR